MNHNENGTVNAPNGEAFQQGKFTRAIGEHTVAVYCDDRLATQAEWLLSTVSSFAEAQPLEDGMTVELGWAVLTLVARDGELVVCEPDFDGEPFESVIEDVTRTLWVIVEQNYIIVETKTEEHAQIPRFDDTIVLWKGVLDDERMYLERSETEHEGDSGWYVGPADDDDDTEEASEDDFEALYVYQLLHKRPQLLSVLGLPVGYVAIFDGDDVEAIFNAEGDDLWNSDEEA